MTVVERIGSATLYCGDCREVLPTLSGIDAVVTDPPYGIGVHSIGCRKNDKRVRRAAFAPNRVIEWDRDPFDPTHLLDVTPQLILWGANHYANRLPAAPGWLVWDKRVNPEFYGTTDQSDCELAWSTVSGAARMWRQIWNGIVRQGEEANKLKSHPTQKPVALMHWCVQKTMGLVCDPYMGSGTTGVACGRLARPFIGIELDPIHFATACRRIEQAHRQPDLLNQLPPAEDPVDTRMADLFAEPQE